MRLLLLKLLFSLMLVILVLLTALTTLVWYVYNASSNVRPGSRFQKTPDSSEMCEGCRDALIKNILERYSQTWTKQQENSRHFRFGGLQERRRPFVESLRHYNDALMLLPAFSYFRNTPVSLRALYTIQDFESPIKPVFLNPEYLQSLARFWRSQGLRTIRLSTGFIVASLALELCTNVHLNHDVLQSRHGKHCM
ncbi:hypothetical protein CRUP_004033 [Coryphaenoides rupestris]|nr:hypothetical protein CRUP_004033 [Coryphaenoides rupestris]